MLAERNRNRSTVNRVVCTERPETRARVLYFAFKMSMPDPQLKRKLKKREQSRLRILQKKNEGKTFNKMVNADD